MLTVGNYLKQAKQNKNYRDGDNGTPCSVTCKEGYYACCSQGTAPCRRCVLDLLPYANGQLGGLGSTSYFATVSTNS